MWKAQIKPVLQKAMQEKDKLTIASTLRQAATYAYECHEKDYAIHLIEISMNFAEGSNIYIYGLMDWRYYTTGEKVSMENINFEYPPLMTSTPWGALKEIVEKME